MTNLRRRQHALSGASRLASRLLLGFVIVMAAALVAQSQTYTVIYSFNGQDGENSQAGVTMDAAGNLYGTTFGGGSQNCTEGCGTVYKLALKNGTWLLSTLYVFQGGSDSAFPSARVVLGPDGALYGTTVGGSYANCANGCGTVFRLQPPATFCRSVTCPWTKTTLYAFTGYPDGNQPQGGDLVFDHAGNIYGTTYFGGTSGSGTVFKLSPTDGGWTESVLYNFTGLSDGKYPNGGVVFDSAGNLYGTTVEGGHSLDGGYDGAGVIFELSPSGSGWTETVVYAFMDQSDGAMPSAGVTLDNAGNMYGTTYSGGGAPCQYGAYSGCGTVFKNGPVLYAFNGSGYGPNGGPLAPVTLDAEGNVYGTTYMHGANNEGAIFKLSAGDYAYTSLYDFGLLSGGVNPISNVTFDSSGNMYGTATGGGGHGYGGVVWKVTP